MVLTRQLTIQEAEAFLSTEARLLDERRLEDWLTLFTEDGVYWLPIEDAEVRTEEPVILIDDTGRRAQRVYQLLYTSHYCQMPPSRTVHYVSNVEVEDASGDAEAVVRCNVLVLELRPGDHRQNGLGQQRALGGRCVYRLRYSDGWKIALKKVLLIDRDLPITNLSFII